MKLKWDIQTMRFYNYIWLVFM